MLKENERLDYLEIKDLKIIQNTKQFCFGCDAVLLTYFAKNRIKKSVIDLGCGNGVIPILLSAKTNASKIIGLEIQKEVADLASRNIKLNNLENRISIINGDIKNIKKIFSSESFDTVVSNPPYMKENPGFQSKDEVVAIARFEIQCKLEDVIKGASYLLASKGNFVMIHRVDRLVDCLSLLRKYKLEPKNLQFITPHENTAPNLFMVNSIKDSNPSIKIEKSLAMRNQDGSYTDEINMIYNKAGN